MTKAVIKVPPVKVGKIEYKVPDIDIKKKNKIGNLLFKSAQDGEYSYDLMNDILLFVGFKEDEVLLFSFEETATIGNAIIETINKKKKGTK